VQQGDNVLSVSFLIIIIIIVIIVNMWGDKCMQIGEPGRRRLRCEDNIKMNVTEICCLDLDQISLIDFSGRFLWKWQ
jgi:hypothetical protein